MIGFIFSDVMQFLLYILQHCVFLCCKKSSESGNIWLVVFGLMAPETVFQSISDRLPDREKEEK